MDKESTKRYIQYILTLGLAVYLAGKWASGKLSYYINMRFFPLTLFAIGALSLMATAGWLRLYKHKKPEFKAQTTKQGILLFKALSISLIPVLAALFFKRTMITWGAYGLTALLGWLLLPHSKDRQPMQANASRLASTSLLILSLPLIIGLTAPENPLTSSSLSTRGISLNAPVSISQQASDTLAVTPDDRTILDWIRLFNYESDHSDYIGADVNVIGFVYHDSRLPEGEFMVSRFIITCCVADAIAIVMPVDGQIDAQLSDNTWVNVQGTLDETQIDEQIVPMIHATSIKIVPAPEQPYLYP